MSGVALHVGIDRDAKDFRLPRGIHWIHPSNDLSSDMRRFRNMRLEDAMKLPPRQLGPLVVNIPAHRKRPPGLPRTPTNPRWRLACTLRGETSH
eukprot:scaffold1452_cov174-Amphora_coffeaeformis.AAC.7